MAERLNSFESAILRSLQKRIRAQMEDHAAAVCSGSCRGPDAASTAASYEGKIQYAQALRDVMDWAEEIEQEMLRGSKL